MRLLLAEDERELSNALAVILKHNHYSVDTVYDGADALEYLRTENYDALILDLMMPKVDGITVLRTLRVGGNGIPVLILSARSEIDDRVLGLDCGADDYLTKPFAAKELLARLRAITRRQGEGANGMGPDLSFGNISLNRAKFELSSPHGTQRLANKEFQMLEMLMMNPGQLISTEHFMEKIWGYDSEAELNVVWVNLSYLRKKLSALHADVRIKAARNQGYSLEHV